MQINFCKGVNVLEAGIAWWEVFRILFSVQITFSDLKKQMSKIFKSSANSQIQFVPINVKRKKK